MCLYCYCGDNQFRWDPPWKKEDGPWHPNIPMPHPMVPPWLQGAWPIERLLEFEDLLKRIKALEDQLGCPCEPNKADYLALIRERIEKLEKHAPKK